MFQEISMRIADKANVDWRIIYRAAKDLNKELMGRFTIRAFDWDHIFAEVARRFGGVSMDIEVGGVLMRHVRDFKPFDGSLELLRLIRDLGA
ncbi:hypothetical protein [Vulcanisaeta distributa]|uniref:hypothetical protein n=1 Tax=Vulcanisaeta distributa TaxID=164451 RepID=UPI001FB1C491|nr:hypothetical protein [Vulcanisaeta distributa]